MNNITLNGREYILTPADQQTNNHQLHYPNGAVTSDLQSGQDYWTPYRDGQAVRSKWENDATDRSRVFLQKVFLTEDACARAIDVDVNHGSLLAKIVEINKAYNWVADWDDVMQIKYWLTWDHRDSGKEFGTSTRNNHGLPVMCEQARDFMMSARVADAAFKDYLKIYK